VNWHHSLTVSALRYCTFLMKALSHFYGFRDSGRVNYVFCFMRVEWHFFFQGWIKPCTLLVRLLLITKIHYWLSEFLFDQLLFIYVDEINFLLINEFLICSKVNFMNSHHSLTVSAVRYCIFPMKALPHFDGLCDSGRVNNAFCFMRVE